MRLRSAGSVPPIVLASPELAKTNTPELPKEPGSAVVPAASVPRKLPATVSPPLLIVMSRPYQWFSTRPRIVLPSLPAARTSPSVVIALPSITTRCTELSPSRGPLLFALEPGCENPLIVTGLVIAGSWVAGVIVWTPAAGMSKSIVSAPGFAFASRIAWRREPAPESLVFVTVYVLPSAAAASVQAKTEAADRSARLIGHSFPEGDASTA